jgi:hypothetical protein
MRVPAAPPTPETTGRAENAALTNRRSRSSWTSPQQPQASVNRHTTTPPLRKGLAIRPTHGYSWLTLHMEPPRVERQLVSRALVEDRAGTRSFAFQSPCGGSYAIASTPRPWFTRRICVRSRIWARGALWWSKSTEMRWKRL